MGKLYEDGAGRFSKVAFGKRLLQVSVAKVRSILSSTALTVPMLLN